MSVQSEINRISGNVTAALAAIAEKGVSVPNGSKSDALAQLIAAIESGGGGEVKFLQGSITPSTASATHRITHDFGVIPQLALYIASEPLTEAVSGRDRSVAGFWIREKNIQFNAVQNKGSSISASSTRYYYYTNLADITTSTSTNTYMAFSAATTSSITLVGYQKTDPTITYEYMIIGGLPT